MRVIVGFAAGGAADLVARLMGQWLSERLGQSFIIENRPGAGSNTAAEAVTKAPPDGYTFPHLTVSNAINATLDGARWTGGCKSRSTRSPPRSRTSRRAGCVPLAPTDATRSPALPDLPAGGVVSGGVVLADQMRSVSWIERHAKFGAAAPTAVLAEVRAKIAALIEIE